MSEQGIAGIVNVLKPPGISSHQVVAGMRRILGLRQVGHGGTLDPGAAGVLPILVGKATKLMPYLLEQPKSYRAEMTLGISTDTQDASGKTVDVRTNFKVKPVQLADAIAAFLGEIEQVPPMASALQKGGVRLYDLARQGRTVEREPRRVHVYEAHVRAVWPAGTEMLHAGTRVLVDFTCSKGTYIRTLCHDIGARLGCGAHMSFLVRTRVGPFHLSESRTLDELREAVQAARLAEWLHPPQSALGHLARVKVDAGEANRLRRGERLPLRPDGSDEPEGVADGHSPRAAGGVVQVIDADNTLVCIARIDLAGGRAMIQPVRVL